MTIIRSLEKLPVAPPSRLVGRNTLLQQINGHLSQQESVLLFGIPGVGKRALAATLAASRIQALGSLLWLTTSHSDLQTLANQVLRAYILQAGSNMDETIIGLLEKHAPLIVINNQVSHDIAARFIRKYVQGKAPVLVLNETAADGPWETILVRRMDEAASYELYSSFASTGGIPRSQNAPVSALLDTLNGHPFSIRLAALQVANNVTNPSALLAALPSAPNDPIEQAIILIRTAFNLLDHPSQGLLLVLCATFSSGISSELVRKAIGNTAGTLCANLVDRGLLTQRAAPDALYYDIHPLVQNFALQRLNENGAIVQAKDRMLGAIVTFTQQYTQHEQHHALLLWEMDNILNAALYCLENSHLEPLEQILAALSKIDVFMYNWGYHRELQELKEKASRRSPALSTSEHKSISVEETMPSSATMIKPRQEKPRIIAGTEMFAPPQADETTASSTPLKPAPEETRIIEGTEMFAPPRADDTTPRKPKGLEQAIVANPVTALATPLQNMQAALMEAAARHELPVMARINMQIGDWYLGQHDPHQAAEAYNTAVSLYQEMGNLRALLDALEVLAECFYHHIGAHKALDPVRRGINIADQLGEESALARFWVRMGDIQNDIGDKDTSLDAYKKAIKLTRRLAEEEMTGITLNKLAALYMDAERYREAATALSQAINLFVQVGRRDLEGRSLGNLGTALGYLERWHEAGQRHNAALKIARALGDSEEERFQLRNLAYVSEIEGHDKWAVHYNRQALYLALLEEDQPAIGEITFELGRMLMNDPDSIAQAALLLERSIAISPHLEALRLLKEATLARKKRETGGRYVPPYEPDLLAYAAAAYPSSDKPR